MSETLNISVVIPYYKSSSTIERAVDSVLNQTKLPKEIIIVDDYSNTDEDLKVLDKLSKQNLVKVIFSKYNSGPGKARNIGINSSEGKYIAFLDSDDIWKSNKLEVQFLIMEKYQLFLSGHLSSIYDTKETNKNTIKQIKKASQLFKNNFGTRTVMILNNNKYRFEEEKRYSEDYLLWTQIVLDGKKSVVINKTLAYSFKEDYGESGLSANINNMYFGAIDAYRILEKERKISSFQSIVLVIYQSVKHIFRLVKVRIRERKSK